MESNPLLNSTMPPNTWRITSTGFFKICFSKTYPEMLRGIMQEGEFVDLLKRLDETLYTSLWIILPMVSPFILFIPIPIISIVSESPLAGMIYGVFWFVLSVAIWIITILKTTRKAKAADARVNEILGELNQRFYSRGVKWMYVRGNKYMPTYIDIMFFNPNVFPQGAMPNPWGQPSYSAINTPASTNPYMNSTPSSYSLYNVQSQPPMQYTPSAPPSLIPDSSSIITPSADMSYPGDPSPSYPGDPSAGYY